MAKKPKIRYVVFEDIGNGLLQRVGWTFAVSKDSALNNMRYRLYGDKVCKDELNWRAYADPQKRAPEIVQQVHRWKRSKVAPRPHQQLTFSFRA